MKKFLSALSLKYKKFTFFQGVVFAVCFSSLISIAATNLPGFFAFTAGSPISSSEINSNFEKLAGNIVLQASYPGFSITETNFIVPTDCSTCHVYRKKIDFATPAISDSNFKSATDLDSNYSSHNGTFSYYQVATAGWYEIRFVPSLALSINSSTCNNYNCSHNIAINSSVVVADSVTTASSSTNFSWLNSGYLSKDQRDTNSDGVFDQSNNWPGQPPEIKRYYLKQGQVIFVRAEANFNATDVTATYSAGVNGLELTIIKL